MERERNTAFIFSQSMKQDLKQHSFLQVQMESITLNGRVDIIVLRASFQKISYTCVSLWANITAHRVAHTSLVAGWQEGSGPKDSHSLVSVSVCWGCCNKLPQTTWLNRHSFLTVLEAQKSKIKTQADLVPDKNPPLTLQVVAVSSHGGGETQL